MTSEDATLAPCVPEDGDPVQGDHLVWLGFASDLTETVMAQAGIEPGQVYRSWYAGFGAVLSGEQVAAVRRIPGVNLVERDTEGRPAPHARTSGDRVEGSYIVSVAEGADPAAVATRLGVAPTGVFHALSSFAAEMTDAQLDRVRRDPEVTDIGDDAWIYVDD
ncbi:hypothetical protein AB0D32_14505 [Micromonospora sp. NPDC048170]|uniref:hypothetical protein n=1 Tax=Micromonospora sp. NPDC048170 TaxID=3154819 RepID=UPI0034106096